MDRWTPLQREIAEAYVRHWEVVARAQFDLDSFQLKAAMAGDELARSEEDIRRLRAAGHAAHVEVELNFRIVKATADQATVYDEYVNRSVLLDAVTKQRISTKEPTPNVVKMSFEMRKIDGTWKVVAAFDHG
jgi:hypothetical protein